MDSDAFIVIFLIFIGAAIVAAVMLIKRSNEKSKEAENHINQIMALIPEDKKMLFMMQYNNSKKNPTTAVLLALFLGGIGIHKFYLGKVMLGIVFLIFCWTYIPSIIGFIEAFFISEAVSKYNENKALEIATMLGAPSSFI